MHIGKLVFAPLLDHLPRHTFRCWVTRYDGKSQGQIIQVSRPMPRYERCSIDRQSKPSGYRGLSSCPTRKVLPQGYSGKRLSQHSLQCQQSPRLENVRRLCSAPAQDGTAPLCPRSLRARSRQYYLCARRLHNRSLSLRVSLGALSFHQISCHTPYPARFTRQYPNFHPYRRRQATRRHGPRSPHPRARGVLPHGSRVSGFRTTLHPESSRRLLRHSRQEPYPLHPSGLSSHRQIPWAALRSTDYSDRNRFKEGLSTIITADQLSRRPDRQNLQFPDQQLFATPHRL